MLHASKTAPNCAKYLFGVVWKSAKMACLHRFCVSYSDDRARYSGFWAICTRDKDKSLELFNNFNALNRLWIEIINNSMRTKIFLKSIDNWNKLWYNNDRFKFLSLLMDMFAWKENFMKKLSRFLLCLMCSGSMIVSSTAINVSAFE